MLLYIVLACWMLGLSILGIKLNDNLDEQIISKDRKELIIKVLFLTTVIAVWFLTAFRSVNIGNDTYAYISKFNQMVGDKSYNPWPKELAYVYYNRLVSFISDDPHLFLIITATILYLLVGVYIWKYSRNILVSFALFFCFFFSAFTNTLRQDFAMVGVLYAYQLIKQNRRIPAIILIVIASLFHNTAIMAVLLFFRSKSLINRKVIISLAVIIVVTSVFGIFNRLVGFLFPKYAIYFVSEYASTGRLGVSYEVFRALILYVSGSCICDYENTSDQLCQWNHALLLLICCFGYSMNLFTRAGQFFLLIATVEFPNLLYERNYEKKNTFLFGLCAFFMIMFLAVLVFRPEWNHLYPYEFWS